MGRIRILSHTLLRTNAEYKNLKHLDFNVHLAETPAFTRGPLFTKEEIAYHEEIREKESELSQEQQSEERDIEKELTEIKEDTKENFWKGINDNFFRRA